MAFLKINGFHTATTGSNSGIGTFLKRLDDAGVPFLAYCADGTTSLIDAQNIMQHSNVPHHAIFRRTHFPHNQSNSDVPDYQKDPEVAARQQWESHRERWPRELDKRLIFGETINELRKEVKWADWIGEFCFHTAKMALRDGFKWCGPGYSSGTPDEGAWETPGMLKFLDLCAQHPHKLGVALHEYSFRTDSILRGSGTLVGRFKMLIDTCRKHNIDPPTIFFTEWGWAERDVPTPAVAMEHIKQAGELYAKYPSVKGAAIWALDGGWGSLDTQTHRLMEPLTRLLIETRYPDPTPGEQAPPAPVIPQGGPRAQYDRTYLTVPQDVSLDQWLTLCRDAYAKKQTIGFSYDDAGIGALGNKTAVLYGIPLDKQQQFRDWYAENYPGTKVIFRKLP